MYIIPGYTKFIIENDVLSVKSELFQSELIIDEKEIINEFNSIVNNGGFETIDTNLKKVLYEEGMVQTKKEIKESLEEVKRICDDDLFITIMPTENCNFKCIYCYENITNNVISDEILNHIQNYISLNIEKCNNLNISWFGGEPTLCKKKIIKFSHFIKTISQMNNVKYSADMTTNGFLLNKENFIDYFNAGIKHFQVTVDGSKHDIFRPHKSGVNTLEIILDNLLSISELSEEFDFEITIRRNISKNNNDLIWYDYLKSIFGEDDRFKLMVAITSDWGGTGVKSIDLINKNKKQTRDLHENYIKKIGMPVIGKNKSPFSDVCYSSFNKGFIFRPNGNIEKCTIALGRKGNVVGNVDSNLGILINEDLNKIWTKSNIYEDCIRCDQVLSCLNIACRKIYAIDGVRPNKCLCQIKSEE